MTHTLSFICIIFSHLRQNCKLLCPKVVALLIRLQVSITFRIYYLIIHQCNKIISKFTSICLTGSFLPYTFKHLVGLLRHEIVLLPFFCISHFIATRNEPTTEKSLQQIEIKVCFYVLDYHVINFGFHLGRGYLWASLESLQC